MDAHLVERVLVQSNERPVRFANLSRTYRIGSASVLAIMVAPFLVLGASFALLSATATRPAMLWMLQENHPVEILTFALAFFCSLAALRLAGALRSHGADAITCGFYTVFSLGLFVVAMEEIAWGQKLLGFATPAWMLPVNMQGETTLHNLGSLQGKSEWMRLAFAIGGIAGVGISRIARFERISPPTMLLPWFLLITAHAVVDAYNDVFPIEERFDNTMQRTSEVVELLIAGAALLYVLLNRQRFRFATWPEQET
jgi:hypothetical protein